MTRFWNLTQKVPKHVWIFKISLRISLLSVNEIWELKRISYEKYRSIITNHIPISLFCIEFNCKTSWISFCICRTLFSSNSRKKKKNRCFFTNLIQKFGFAISWDIISHFKIPMCTRSFGMNNSFWNSFSIKRGQFINKMCILH